MSPLPDSLFPEQDEQKGETEWNISRGAGSASFVTSSKQHCLLSLSSPFSLTHADRTEKRKKDKRMQEQVRREREREREQEGHMIKEITCLAS